VGNPKLTKVGAFGFLDSSAALSKVSSRLERPPFAKSPALTMARGASVRSQSDCQASADELKLVRVCLRESDDLNKAACSAMALARKRGLRQITPDELLLGCLRVISQFGIARIGDLSVDLEELGVDWLSPIDVTTAEVAYSKEALAVLDQAARIGQASDSAAVPIADLLAAFSIRPCGVMAELKERQQITAVRWRTAVAQFASAPTTMAGSTAPANSSYLTPEQAADVLHVHVQTIRDYIRSGKLRAFRLAGERALRIRRADLESLLEPL
jgi:excisionase family DNA binding protein